MIQINCDNCERDFAVDDETAGGKVPCPLCGDINRVPSEPAARGAFPAQPAVVAVTAIPADGPERELCVVRPAMMRAHPFRFLLILGLLGAGIAGTVWGWRTEATGGTFVSYLGLTAIAAGAIWLVVWWIATTLWIKVTITNKRTVRHEGIIRRHSTEVLHDHVRSVDINQKFTHRLLNVGYIGIDSAGQDGIEIELRDIPGPYEIKKLIDQYRKM